jgi:hypothetical protein
MTISFCVTVPTMQPAVWKATLTLFEKIKRKSEISTFHRTLHHPTDNESLHECVEEQHG